MIFKYRGIAHPQNEIALLSVTKRQQRGQTGRKMIAVIDWFIRGVKVDTTQPGLTAKLAALESQYGTDGGDAVLYLNDGATATQHQLISANTLNGVRVIGGVNYEPGWEGVWGVRTEYVYRRTFSVRLRAEVLANESSIFLYHQTIRQIGLGGADFEFLETLNTLPVYQQTNAYTAYDAEQFGMAIGVTNYPSFPLPFWPTYLKPRQSIVDLGTPQLFGTNANLYFPISWRYRFRGSTGGLFSSPPTYPTF